MPYLSCTWRKAYKTMPYTIPTWSATWWRINQIRVAAATQATNQDEEEIDF